MLALPTALVVPESANLLFRLMTEESEEFDNKEWEKVRDGGILTEDEEDDG